jgi:hypothetical protein
MPETWIRPNRRALALGFVLPLLMLISATVLALLGLGAEPAWPWFAAAGLLTLFAAIVVLLLWRTLRRPRVAYDAGEVLLYFDATEPARVPVEAVECFFLGQAGGLIPDAQGREAEVRTVIVRLAEAATDWHHRDLKPDLGHWCEGYITIRGTWCEPITPDLMKQLNSRLVQVHRERKQQRTTEASP